MNATPAAPWGRLAPLAGVVLAVHLLALHGTAPFFAPAREPAVQRFNARTLQLPAHLSAALPPGPEEGQPKAVPRAPSAPARRGTTPRPAPAVAGPSAAPAPVASVPDPNPLVTAPPPATLHYEVTVQSRGLTHQGIARLEWRHDGSAYELRLELAAGTLPPRTQSSRGRITPQGLAPDYFHDKARSEQATHFDREDGRVVFSANRPPVALATGMQDRASVVMQLAMLLAADPARLVPGARIALPTAGTREAGDWIFEVAQEEDLLLPGGALQAWKLERAVRGPYDQRMELWFAPGQAYAPVRLRLTNPDGGTVDQRWSSTDRG